MTIADYRSAIVLHIAKNNPKVNGWDWTRVTAWSCTM